MIPSFILDLFAFSEAPIDSSLFFLIAGPCVIEDESDSALDIALHIQACCQRHGIPFIFKTSYRKANRTSHNSFAGIGDEKALTMIRQIGERLAVPTTTDIHAAHEAQMVTDYVDILQIPAFLCRQSDILAAAAKTDKIVNIKKGQFLSGHSMKFVAEKVRSITNQKIIFTERGNMFGYQDLVVDMRNIPIMQSLGSPVVMDCTHSLQRPNQQSGIAGGAPTMISTIARAAIAAGADGIFIETHPQPELAKSDGENMLPLENIGQLLDSLVRIKRSLVS